MDGKTNKKKYESPMIIDLGQVPLAQGQIHECQKGSGAISKCASGTGFKTSGTIILPEPQVEKIEPNFEKIEPRIEPHISP